MLKLKTKWFNKWANKNSISDDTLIDTLESLANNLNSVSLGGGLFKVRTAKTGQGKSGGFRTIVVYKKEELAVFVYGFSKSDKDNLDKNELKYFKKLANDLLKINALDYLTLVKSGSFFSLKEEQ